MEGAMKARDLALAGGPITDMFEQPDTAAGWDRYRLTDAQVASFHENGFVTGIRILADEQVERLRAELAELLNPNHPGRSLFYHYKSNESVDPSRVLFHALGAWRVTPGFHDLWWAPAFRMAAAQLLGGTVRLFHDQLFCKPAHHGGVVAWHQDYSYWTWTTPMAHLTCWIGLDDANTENGCLYYIPGSHRWGLLPVTGLAGDMEAVRKVLSPEQLKAFEKRVPVILKKGEAAFHHPLTMHGSYENRSERQRRAVVLNVLRDGARFNIEGFERADDLKNFPTNGHGKPVDGPYYPVLIDPAALDKRQTRRF